MSVSIDFVDTIDRANQVSTIGDSEDSVDELIKSIKKYLNEMDKIYSEEELTNVLQEVNEYIKEIV